MKTRLKTYPKVYPKGTVQIRFGIRPINRRRENSEEIISNRLNKPGLGVLELVLAENETCVSE